MKTYSIETILVSFHVATRRDEHLATKMLALQNMKRSRFITAEIRMSGRRN